MEKINFINDTTPALNATNLNKLQQNVEDVTGDLTELETSAKTNLVAAINEAASTGSGGDTLPIYSIVDYDGDTVPSGYEEVNSYSTSEVKTGDTWIDGRPLYRKVIQTTNVTFNGYTMLAIESNTNLIKYEVYIRRNDNRLDKYATGTKVENAMLVSSIRSTGIELWTDAAFQTGFIELYAIIEYTKTTD